MGFRVMNRRRTIRESAASFDRFRRYLEEEDDEDRDDDEWTGDEEDLFVDEEGGGMIKDLPEVDNVADALEDVLKLLTPDKGDELAESRRRYREAEEDDYLFGEDDEDDSDPPVEAGDDGVDSPQGSAVDPQDFILALSILQGLANSTDPQAMEVVDTISQTLSDAVSTALDNLSSDESGDEDEGYEDEGYEDEGYEDEGYEDEDDEGSPDEEDEDYDDED